MDVAPIILIATPVLLPVVVQAGMSPITFGIVLMVNLAIGLTTPPVGQVSLLAAASARPPGKMHPIDAAVVAGHADRSFLYHLHPLADHGAAELAHALSTRWLIDQNSSELGQT